MGSETLGEIIKAISDRWNLCKNAEITLEANPSSAEKNKFIEYKIKLESVLNKKIDELKNLLLQNQSKLKNPITKLREISQRLDNADLSNANFNGSGYNTVSYGGRYHVTPDIDCPYTLSFKGANLTNSNFNTFVEWLKSNYQKYYKKINSKTSVRSNLNIILSHKNNI